MKLSSIDLKVVLPALLLLVAGGAAWAIVAFKPQTLPQTPLPNVPVVEVIKAEARQLALNVYSQGVVMPRQPIDLVAEVGGKIVQLHPAMVPGGFFADHEQLLTVDTRDYDYAIVSAEAGVAEAKRALIAEQAQVEQAHAEWQALGVGEASDLALRKPQLAEAEAKLKAAQAALAKAKLNRNRCELRAPFAGRVLTANIGLGQYVQAGVTVARIYPSDLAEIRLPVGTDQLAFLDLPLGTDSTRGHWPNVTLKAEIGGKTASWQGRIVRSEAILDQASGQLYLVAQVKDPYRAKSGQPPLLNGLFVQAEIEGRTRDGLFALPRASVNSLQQVKIVDADQRLQFRQLELLRSETDQVIVKAGLQDGDLVIVSDMAIPVTGMKVAAAETQAEAQQP